MSAGIGAYTGDATDVMLAALAAVCKDAGTFAATAVPGTWTSSGATWTCSTKHGLSVGNKVVLKTGFSGSGVKENWLFYVKAVPTEETAELSRQVSASKAWTAASGVSAATFDKVVELTETRAAVTWTLVEAKGLEEDATAVTVAITAAHQTVSYVFFDSAETGGTIYFVIPVTPETFETTGSLEIKKSEFDLNAA
jgi:hypothetical protein